MKVTTAGFIMMFELFQSLRQNWPQLVVGFDPRANMRLKKEGTINQRSWNAIVTHVPILVNRNLCDWPINSHHAPWSNHSHYVDFSWVEKMQTLKNNRGRNPIRRRMEVKFLLNLSLIACYNQRKEKHKVYFLVNWAYYNSRDSHRGNSN